MKSGFAEYYRLSEADFGAIWKDGITIDHLQTMLIDLAKGVWKTSLIESVQVHLS